jgi:hypothetical protein
MGRQAVRGDVAQGSRFSPSAGGRHLHRDACLAARPGMCSADLQVGIFRGRATC